jgi:hypothetical protein
MRVQQQVSPGPFKEEAIFGQAHQALLKGSGQGSRFCLGTRPRVGGLVPGRSDHLRLDELALVSGNTQNHQKRCTHLQFQLGCPRVLERKVLVHLGSPDPPILSHTSTGVPLAFFLPLTLANISQCSLRTKPKIHPN